jgi:hypothetical protein
MKFRPKEMHRLSTTREYSSAEMSIVKGILSSSPLQPRILDCSRVGSAIYCGTTMLAVLGDEDP